MNTNLPLTITVLGSGTSAGVPMIGCHCPVCGSSDPRDKRSRSSIVVSYANRNILIDTSPELRLQAIANKLDSIEAVVFTHAHADHIFGLDDVRRYNALLKAPLPIYAAPETLEALQRIFPYAFARQNNERIFKPELLAHPIIEDFTLFEALWQTIPLLHGRNKVLGFRIGAFAYCTDCSEIPPESLARLQGLEVLIIDGLRPRPHPTHFSFAQALEIIEVLRPQRAFFTHLSHDVFHAEAQAALPEQVRISYDGLRIFVGSAS